MKKLYRFYMCTVILALAITGNTLSNRKELKVSAKGNEEQPRDQKRKPNIINIILDDFGWSDSSLYGSEYYETPHMDEFAKSGVTFTNAYSGSNLCSPSRAMMLTGRYGPRNGVSRLCSPNEKAYETGINPQELEEFRYGFNGNSYLMEHEPAFLPTSEITIAEQLKQVGYTTAHIGKWHLGDPERGTGPLDQGFDINIGGYHRGQPPTYFSPYNIPYLENGPKGEYLSDRLGDEAVKFIKDYKDKPFFLNFSQYAVHTPLQAKKELVDKYRGKEPSNGQDNPTYAGVIESADDAIGQVIDAVKELGLEEDTMIVITSDNGGLHYWNVTSNAPLRKGKCFNYEGGIRVPTIISWKGQIEPGQVNDTPIHQIDLFPTFSELAGIDLPTDRKIDGESLMPLLTKGDDLERKSLYWYNPHFNPDTALVLNENPDKNNGKGDDEAIPNAVIRTGNYKLIKNYAPASYCDSVEFELYNLKDDIGESHNLADEMPKKVAEMKKDLERWLFETNAIQPYKVTLGISQVEEDGKLNHADMSVVASSQNLQHPASKVLDDNEQTYWQSANDAILPQSLTIDLKQMRYIDKISYLPRNDNREGTITYYKIYTSIDGVNYNHVTSGSWDNDSSLKYAQFNSVEARYVKIRAIEANNGKASAAEINVFEDNQIISVEEVFVKTIKGIAPVMPDEVTVIYANGKKGKRPVIWQEDSQINYQNPGNYELDGNISSGLEGIKAKITVDDDVADKDALIKNYGNFDGIKDSFWNLPNSLAIDFSDTFSIQFQLNLNGLNGNWQTLIERYNESYQGFKLNVSPEGYVTFHVLDSITPANLSRPWIAMQSKDQVPLNEWTSIRLAFSAKYHRAYLYINDQLTAEAIVLQPIETISKALSVGSQDVKNYGLNGSLSDIRVYNSFMRETSKADSSLKDIKIDGVSMTNFDPEVLEYTQEVSKEVQQTPVVTPILSDEKAKVEISSSTTIPGDITIKVTAMDHTYKIYIIHFKYKEELLSGDFNQDGKVDLSDLGIATAMFGQKNNDFDLNHNGIIDDFEINYILDKMLK